MAFSVWLSRREDEGAKITVGTPAYPATFLYREERAVAIQTGKGLPRWRAQSGAAPGARGGGCTKQGKGLKAAAGA